jgi:hypothetical protein
LGSRFKVGRRDLDTEHGPCPVNELTLKDGELERALDGLSGLAAPSARWAAFDFDNGRR